MMLWLPITINKNFFIKIKIFIFKLNIKIKLIYLLERNREGSAAIVGKPVAEVTVENVIFETRGFDA